MPTEALTAESTEALTAESTEAPTAVPTEALTAESTEAPSMIPTAEPIKVPTQVIKDFIAASAPEGGDRVIADSIAKLICSNNEYVDTCKKIYRDVNEDDVSSQIARALGQDFGKIEIFRSIYDQGIDDICAKFVGDTLLDNHGGELR